MVDAQQGHLLGLGKKGGGLKPADIQSHLICPQSGTEDGHRQTNQLNNRES